MTRTILGGFMLSCAMLVSGTGFSQTQSAIDEKILTDYFAEHHIKATKTPSGLYYVINKTGKGEKAKSGQTVTMNYIGKFLDGKVFAANVDNKNKPVNGKAALNLQLGVGHIVRGWDEGVQLLNPGSKATLYIQSGLAYGPMARSPIPAHAILVMDVELLSVDN